MNTREKERVLDLTGTVIAAVSVLFLAGLFVGYHYQRASDKERAKRQAGQWREGPQVAAYVMIDRYGPPDRVEEHQLTWYGRRPWKRIVVHDDPPQSPIEGVVGYQLTARALAAVTEFGHGVKADAHNAEISARGSSEELDRLALNVVDEVAQGGRNVAQARAFYVKTAELSVSGKSSPYMERLLFKPYEPAVDVWVRDFKY